MLFRSVYEVGPRGVAQGGAIFLHIPPFWGWTSPQSVDPRELGWVKVTVDADVKWESTTVDQQLLMVKLTDGGLQEGDRIEFEYHGRADKYAERKAAFWMSVDGDGDGIRQLDRKSVV